MPDYVVCGWYTPDYQRWADRLLSNLRSHGLPHDIVRIDPLTGSWEKKTRTKAEQVLKAMDRHPDKTILFLDVDCEVRDPVKFVDLKSKRCDVGFYIRTRFRTAGGIKWGVRSGTLLFQPTDKARAFVEAWRDLNSSAPLHSHDQDTLMVAIGKVPGCAFSVLDLRYCATDGDGLRDPWVLHSSASENTPKISKWRKRFSHWLGSRSHKPEISGSNAPAATNNIVPSETANSTGAVDLRVALPRYRRFLERQFPQSPFSRSPLSGFASS